MNLTSGDILGPDGRVAARLSSYEHREQQVAMAAVVAEALASRSPLVVEAGTGVGKSFGYLVPAILAVTDRSTNIKRVVVSTHTISLQEQLLQKDIPFLNSVIPREFTALLAKGRGNYV
ncbi:MAG: DEAD/DEAH box helicase, partial [Pirellulaceae bacterium]